MQVILRSDVDGLGKTGDVLDVAAGYARNYLVPKGLAMKASPGAITQAASMRRARDTRDSDARAAAEEVAKRLVPEVVSISARVGRGDTLYGSVTTADIAAAVESQTGIEIDRRVLSLDEPIKTTGTHSVNAKLHTDVQFAITVEVAADS